MGNCLLDGGTRALLPSRGSRAGLPSAQPEFQTCLVFLTLPTLGACLKGPLQVVSGLNPPPPPPAPS